MPDLDYQPDAAYFDTMARHARDKPRGNEGRRLLVREIRPPFREPFRTGSSSTWGCIIGDNMEMLGRRAGSGRRGHRTSVHMRCSHAVRKAAPRSLWPKTFPSRLVRAHWSRAWMSSSTSTTISWASANIAAFSHRAGLLLLTVPAYQWLWGEHDVRAAHRRRYRVGGLASVEAAAGFEVLRTTYYNSFLVPPAALLRRGPSCGAREGDRRRGGQHQSVRSRR